MLVKSLMRIANNIVKTLVSDIWTNAIGSRGEFAALRADTAFTLLEDLSEDVCAALISRIDATLEVTAHPRVWRDSSGSDARIWGFEKDIGRLIDEFQIERRITAIEKYLGRTVRSWYLMANRVEPVVGNLGSGGGLHRDSPFSHQVKCIWYLTDVTDQNGPFQYLPGSHTNLFGSRKKYPLGEYRLNHLSKDDHMVEVLSGAGTLLVCDTKCIHGGKPIKSGSRYAVTLYTSPHEGEFARQLRALGLSAPTQMN